MKTIQEKAFMSTNHQFVDSILHQILGEPYGIIQVFFHQTANQQYSQLVIVVAHQKEAEMLLQKKWIEKSVRNYQVNVCILDTRQIHEQFQLGNPFVELYCRTSFLIYQDKESGKPSVNNRNKKKFREVFEDYKDLIFHERDLLLTQIERFEKEKSSISAVLAYETVFQYDLGYLEALTTGNRSQSENLSERIKNLVRYVPELQRCFVAKNTREYYLIHLINETKISAKEGELIYKGELMEAFRIAQDELSLLVEMRLDHLSKMIKKVNAVEEKQFMTAEETNIDAVLEAALETISKAADCEEIFLFHKTIHGNNITYYLLIIGFNIGNTPLKSMSQSLESKIGEAHHFVLISHSRSWIQEKLSLYQSFFVPIIQGKNKVYESHAFHPEPHWEFPHTLIYSDLDYYYESTVKSAKQFLAIAENPAANYQGLPSLFSLFFMSFCRTYIYAQLYYLPHYLSFTSLWGLCEYANPELHKYRYLFEEFRKPFFAYLDYHMELRHDITRLDQEEVEKMRMIVEKLQDELKVVIKGKVLE